MKKLMSKSDFAKLNNVSAAAITKACANALKSAFDGKRIDANHPVSIAYIEKKKKQQSLKKDSEKLKKVKTSNINNEIETGTFDNPIVIEKKEPHVRGHNAKKENDKNDSSHHTSKGIEVPQHIKKYLYYTLEDVINEFGTDTALVDFLSAIQKIEIIEEKRIKNDKSKGVLVDRDLVEKGILNPVNAAHTRLLTDGAKTITKRIVAKHETGMGIQELQKFTSEQIGNYFKSMKQTIKNTLKLLETNE
ncbi:MAG: hypothetical protein IMY67_12495 [Bacteroidetes bacterium]|nr:hypothetical protein [Bacteroidota bacterium]